VAESIAGASQAAHGGRHGGTQKPRWQAGRTPGRQAESQAAGTLPSHETLCRRVLVEWHARMAVVSPNAVSMQVAETNAETGRPMALGRQAGRGVSRPIAGEA